MMSPFQEFYIQRYRTHIPKPKSIVIGIWTKNVCS